MQEVISNDFIDLNIPPGMKLCLDCFEFWFTPKKKSDLYCPICSCKDFKELKTTKEIREYYERNGALKFPTMAKKPRVHEVEKTKEEAIFYGIKFKKGIQIERVKRLKKIAEFAMIKSGKNWEYWRRALEVKFRQDFVFGYSKDFYNKITTLERSVKMDSDIKSTHSRNFFTSCFVDIFGGYSRVARHEEMFLELIRKTGSFDKAVEIARDFICEKY